MPLQSRLQPRRHDFSEAGQAANITRINFGIGINIVNVLFLGIIHILFRATPAHILIE
jgi:hypothetical protein